VTASLDDILGGGEAVPEEKPAEVTQPAAPTEEQPTEAQPTEATEGDGRQSMVPQQALHAEKQKVKRYTEEVAEFRRTNEALQRQVGELLQRLPVQKQEQPQPTDFFTDPDTAFHERLQAGLAPALGPVQQQLMAQAEMLAGLKYGDDKVTEAEKAFIDALQSRQVDPMDYRRVVDSPNRYAAAVQWHARQVAQAEIGDDPAAFKAKVEAELREKILAEQGGQQPAIPARNAPAAVMPSNIAGARNVGTRQGPGWSGPQSIGSIFSNNR
jgi:hypothetical protein